MGPKRVPSCPDAPSFGSNSFRVPLILDIGTGGINEIDGERYYVKKCRVIPKRGEPVMHKEQKKT
jgi:hypothetical protein